MLMSEDCGRKSGYLQNTLSDTGGGGHANPTKKGPGPGNRTRDLLSCEAAVLKSLKDSDPLSDVLAAVWLFTLVVLAT